MSNTNGSQEKRAQHIEHLIATRDWDALDQFLGGPPLTMEQVERILREEPMIDAAEVNRLLNVSDEEIADVLQSPPQEISSLPKSRR